MYLYVYIYIYKESRQSKCILFSHLTRLALNTGRKTSPSALPGETGNPEIASFHLNCCMLFHQTRNTVKSITWSELNHPSLSKRLTGCTRQDLGREHSILLSVTYMLCVSQVCQAVSPCVKDGSCSSSNLE